MDILVLADDLTGALEAGAQMAAEGLDCAVSVDARFEGATQALALNLETRHIDAGEAEARVGSAVASFRSKHLFLKTDSTLRGRITESFRALKAEFPHREIAWIPAYPAVGRTVRDGILHVHGIPLAETDFARDPLNPVRDSSARRLGGALAMVFDGECDADLAAAADALRGRDVIVAGTAGFLRPWIRTLPLIRMPAPDIPRVPAGLIVAGSRHPVARSQLASVRNEAQWHIHALPEAMCGEPLEVAATCGQQVRMILESTPLPGLIILGGDTAAAVLRALGCRIAHPYGELLPGVPVSRIDFRGRDITLITKAGGFGDDRTLLRIIETLR